MAKADNLVSQVHDVLWSYDRQPNMRSREGNLVWEQHRNRMNGLIWKLHDLLRAEDRPE